MLRIAVAQLGCTLVAASLFMMNSGSRAAGAALAGGAIATLGGIIFGWRLFAPGVAAAPTVARAMYAAEALKWVWIVVGVWAGLAVFKLAPGPLLSGLVVAQLGHWLGLIRFK